MEQNVWEKLLLLSSSSHCGSGPMGVGDPYFGPSLGRFGLGLRVLQKAWERRQGTHCRDFLLQHATTHTCTLHYRRFIPQPQACIIASICLTGFLRLSLYSTR